MDVQGWTTETRIPYRCPPPRSHSLSGSGVCVPADSTVRAGPVPVGRNSSGEGKGDGNSNETQT